MTTTALPPPPPHNAVEITFAGGSQKVANFGRRESAEKAEADAVEIYKAKSARVLRVTLEHAPDATPVGELIDTWEARAYILRDGAGRAATSEHEGGHLRTAFEFLIRQRPDAKWKTLLLLRTLRQAFREDSVNCHDTYIGELMEAGPTRAAVDAYLAGARCRDRQHHGQNTF